MKTPKPIPYKAKPIPIAEDSLYNQILRGQKKLEEVFAAIRKEAQEEEPTQQQYSGSPKPTKPL